MLIKIIKWTTLSLVVYLYSRYLQSSSSIIQTITGHFGEWDSIKSYVDKIVLSETEEEALIKDYSAIERRIKVAPGCSIGVGYTTCKDIGFRAVDMFDTLKPELAELLRIKEGKLIPQVHESISELHEFVETFLYYFSQGVNAERVAVEISKLN